MTLLELCEPLFQYVCRVNRSARKGVCPDPAQARQEVKNIMSDMRNRAASDRGLGQQFEKVELALLGFVDYMMKESGKGYSRGWKELAHDRNEMAMDEKFFDLLEETLVDPSEQATERLAIYYSCIGLGFGGWYAGQPEYLRKKMMEMAARLRPLMETDRSGRICPEAYEHVDKRDLTEELFKKSLPWIGAALVVLLITVFIANGVAYMDATRPVKGALSSIKSGAAQESGNKEAGR